MKRTVVDCDYCGGTIHHPEDIFFKCLISSNFIDHLTDRSEFHLHVGACAHYFDKIEEKVKCEARKHFNKLLAIKHND